MLTGFPPRRRETAPGHALIALALALGLLAPCPAAAAPAPAAVEAAVRDHLGIYLTVPDRRESGERLLVTGPRLEIWFLRPLKRGQRDPILCDGVRWLLLGRLAAAGGARALFQALPDIDEVTLVFYELETRVEPDAEGRYRQLRNAAPRARFTVSRQKAALLDPVGLREVLKGEACTADGAQLLDTLWAP